ncbi:TPA: prefoldin subunit beta [Candidatus Woesearchaeota archaeon]|nr:prefoldin subunit beta [Candidatus Woesearchaeota archaeon]HIH31959.1 prefoldin subunit beta [Candidatus Woesearchaeota archaeon]HIH54476.1 prefoldin subunit beta [Candidatus Woesearchaeota archaeon]HIJ02123.1 prefoldin subunit beta [Candidatus Woesearchaeota archaeon]HIJ13171.1 prefoldin subunit beta [Candidatus Woesearchaeota archaeon]
MAELQEKINQLQLIQQNLNNFALQRQQFQIQQSEAESALNEISDSKTSYKIIGSIMVKTEPETLKKELEEKLQMLKIRINSIEKQEAKIREKAEELQKEVLSELEKKNDSKTSGKHK